MIQTPWSHTREFPRKNILTPIGALASIIFPTCAAGAAFTYPSQLSWVLLCIGCIPLAVAIWAYIYFVISDPDRLQTEDYRIQHQLVSRISNVSGVTESQLPPRNAKLVVTSDKVSHHD